MEVSFAPLCSTVKECFTTGKITTFLGIGGAGRIEFLEEMFFLSILSLTGRNEELTLYS